MHTGRAALSVRVWEMDSGELAATLTRRKGSTPVTLALPADLEALRELHDKVVAQMKAHNVARQPRTGRKNG
ncbi:hypothetical protein AB0M58_38585 [Streptomyces bobili]|uniref:hypothetical protein n=1 Tax=Streptomyces bobili TaxID=67280 RepID=UPI003430C51B